MITSKNNAQIKNLRKLTESAKARREQDAFIIEGTRLVSEAPADMIRKIYVSAGEAQRLSRDESLSEDIRRKLGANHGTAAGIASGASEKKTGRADIGTDTVTEEVKLAIEGDRLGSGSDLVPEDETIEYVSDDVFRSISGTVNPQGILAIVRQPHHDMDELLGNKHSLYVMLDDVRDPGNLGTIIRTAEAAGANVIISRGSADIFNPKVVRSTMGSIFRVGFVICDLTEAAGRLRAKGINIFAAALDGTDCREVFAERARAALAKQAGTEFTGRAGAVLAEQSGEASAEQSGAACAGRAGAVLSEQSGEASAERFGAAFSEEPAAAAIIIGNEANGISPEVMACADNHIKIPMQGQVESLNAAVSAAILMYALSLIQF